MSKKLSARAGLLLVAAVFLGFVLLSQNLFRGVRLDLTENQLYTLSDGTKSVLAKLEEPVHLRFFFSAKQAQDIPNIRSYANRVRELLAEFEQAAKGNLQVTEIDPEPFSEQEDEAASFGLTGANINNAGEKLYFGLAGTNGIGDQVVIPFFQPNKEAFLEYDVSKLVYELANPEKTVIGLMSGLPVTGGPAQNPMEPAQKPWVLFDQLGAFFEVRNLREDLTQVPDDIDLLMVVHPRDWSEPTQYAIEQFILKGGHAAIFVDPWAERQPADALTGQGDLRSSNLNKMLAAWGIEAIDTHVIADGNYALQVQVAQDRPPVTHLGLAGFQGDAFNPDDIVSQNLKTINMASSGYIWDNDDDLEDGQQRQETGAVLTPLIQSSDVAQPIPVSRFSFLPDPSALLDGFMPTGERYTVAARISGKVPSAWPKDGPEGADVDNPVTQSQGDVNVILVADTDVLSDRLWVQVQQFLGQQIVQPWASNGDFAVNVLDSLSGSSDLISIRSRAGFTRPFTRVADIRKSAEQQFRHKEQELEAKLKETEAQLSQLQQSADDGQLNFSLSPEQQELLLQFQNKQIEIRKELREVRHQLDKDIDQLGSRVKLINIAAVPALVALFALFSGLRRRRKS